jgi:hypothetical protein
LDFKKKEMDTLYVGYLRKKKEMIIQNYDWIPQRWVEDHDILTNKNLNIEQHYLDIYKEELYKKFRDGIHEELVLDRRHYFALLPFFMLYEEKKIIKQIENLLIENENELKAKRIEFPLFKLKEFYLDLKITPQNDPDNRKERRQEWCCTGHYYLYLIKCALKNRGYSNPEIDLDKKIGMNLRDDKFINTSGFEIIIHADAGL